MAFFKKNACTRLRSPNRQWKLSTGTQANSSTLLRWRQALWRNVQILPTMRHILIGMSLFKQNSVTLAIRNHLIHFSDVSLQLHKANGKISCNMCELRAAQKIVLLPQQQIIVPVCTNSEIGTTAGNAETTSTLTRKKALLFTPAMVKLEQSYTNLRVTNPHKHIYMINPRAILANLTVLTPNQAKHMKPVATEHLSLLTQLPDDATAVIN